MKLAELGSSEPDRQLAIRRHLHGGVGRMRHGAEQHRFQPERRQRRRPHDRQSGGRSERRQRCYRAQERRGRHRRLPGHQSECALHPGAGRRLPQRRTQHHTDARHQQLRSVRRQALQLHGEESAGIPRGRSNAFNHAQYTAGYVNSVRATSQTNNRVFLIPGNTQFLQWAKTSPATRAACSSPRSSSSDLSGRRIRPVSCPPLLAVLSLSASIGLR